MGEAWGLRLEAVNFKFFLSKRSQMFGSIGRELSCNNGRVSRYDDGQYEDSGRREPRKCQPPSGYTVTASLNRQRGRSKVKGHPTQRWREGETAGPGLP